MTGVGSGGLAGGPQGHPGGPQPPVRRLLSDPVALGDLRRAQALLLVQAAKLGSAGCSAAEARGSSGDAGVVKPPSGGGGADPVARR
jgi:hypothetical protein